MYERIPSVIVGSPSEGAIAVAHEIADLIKQTPTSEGRHIRGPGNWANGSSPVRGTLMSRSLHSIVIVRERTQFQNVTRIDGGGWGSLQTCDGVLPIAADSVPQAKWNCQCNTNNSSGMLTIPPKKHPHSGTATLGSGAYVFDGLRQCTERQNWKKPVGSGHPDSGNWLGSRSISDSSDTRSIFVTSITRWCTRTFMHSRRGSSVYLSPTAIDTTCTPTSGHHHGGQHHSASPPYPAHGLGRQQSTHHPENH